MEALSDKNLSEELAELIQGWIACDERADRKDEVMNAILERMFLEHRRPVQRTYESLDRVHERLGFPDVGDARVGKRVVFGRMPARIAAVLVAVMTLGGAAVWLTSRQTAVVVPEHPVMVEVAVEKGGDIILPDGSVVRPVGDSRVTVAENFNENRHVTLSGEAFFSVAHNLDSPFTVETEHLTLTVLGTEFNLKDFPEDNETVVSLVSGSVKIDKSSRESVVLAPMERMVFDKRTKESAVSSFTPEQIDRWRSGRRIIENLPLEQALLAVGDFYEKAVIIQGSAPAGSGVSTMLTENVTAESALEAIRLVNNVFDYRITGNTIYIIFGKP